ncbi:MAG: hypothetical protein EZS28_043768, partial [Streblomastix strix]
MSDQGPISSSDLNELREDEASDVSQLLEQLQDKERQIEERDRMMNEATNKLNVIESLLAEIA